ncbi:MAG: cell division protein SepF [Clostridia bacterium]|nr:cell division protein SepF [Clostridia bacterium]
MSGLMNKMLNLVGFDTGESYEEDYYAENEVQDDYDYEEPVIDRLTSRRSSRVVKIHETSSQQMKVVVMQPESFEEARDITNHLKNRKPIVVNLEAIDKNVARRVIDFLSGAIYALDGDIQKISNSIFLLAPNNVGIMSEDGTDTRNSFSWSN